MKVTIDRRVIEEWAKKHNGRPEVIEKLEGGVEAAGLRIDFPGKVDDEFLPESDPPQNISWDKFFQKFEDQKLAFEYRDEEELSDPSDSYRFIKRSNTDEEE